MLPLSTGQGMHRSLEVVGGHFCQNQRRVPGTTFFNVPFRRVLTSPFRQSIFAGELIEDLVGLGLVMELLKDPSRLQLCGGNLCSRGGLTRSAETIPGRQPVSLSPVERCLELAMHAISSIPMADRNRLLRRLAQGFRKVRDSV